MSKVAQYKPVVRCYETHPPLDIGGFKIYGGSCLNPVVKDADVYIGFDRGMSFTHQAYPWEERGHVVEFCFPITDMSAPSNYPVFNKMIEWIGERVVCGDKIHIGCIGGHGRTGTVLAALVFVMTGEKEAIKYVRNNYCMKAVEANSQVEFLKRHYGIVGAEPSKVYSYSVGTPVVSKRDSMWYGGAVSKAKSGSVFPSKPIVPNEDRDFGFTPLIVTPSHSNMLSVWGKEVDLDKLV